MHYFVHVEILVVLQSAHIYIISWPDNTLGVWPTADDDLEDVLRVDVLEGCKGYVSVIGGLDREDDGTDTAEVQADIGVAVFRWRREATSDNCCML